MLEQDKKEGVRNTLGYGKHHNFKERNFLGTVSELFSKLQMHKEHVFHEDCVFWSELFLHFLTRN